ncbi:assimilatory sulfite reductase (NADPH) hemoprotein subunit [Buchnera aphidicola (Mindarus keteleerifoliae)]|uniref:assimilatory sulfite reductase (NADPH) hemoprotein subunit n=1 Tax=Buchnera aphidicola TaxID=9 RepID=UPI0031B6FB6B
MKQKKEKNNLTKNLFSEAEKIKYNSNYLRGTILKDLKNTITNGFTGDNYSLIRFHGMYQQDDRDIRKERMDQKLEPRHAMMLRCRIPGGIVKPYQWLEIDKFSNENTIYKTIRLTNRQTFQFHGIFKKDLKKVHQMLSKIGLDSFATANDVNRNVICTSDLTVSSIHKFTYKWAKKISRHFLPKTNAYAEIWLDKKKIVIDEKEPILGKTYLPRKFKIAIAIPPNNDVDFHANDIALIAISKNEELLGFNVLVGGGLSIEHKNHNTWPSLAMEFGFVNLSDILKVLEGIVTVQRDWGNRVNRKNAKTRYTLHKFGIKKFIAEVEFRSKTKFKVIKPYIFSNRGDSFGWNQNINKKWNYTLYIENGRLIEDKRKIKSGLFKIALIHDGDFRITANQNIIIYGISEKNKSNIEKIIFEHMKINDISKLQKMSMACVSFPTCPLAMAEAERVLTSFIQKIDKIMEKYNLVEETIIVRITGCPNGCARSLLAEIGLIGKSLDRYDLYIGGNKIGTRIPRLYRENYSLSKIIKVINPMIKRWSLERLSNECFGDFLIRVKIIKNVSNFPSNFWKK